MRLGFVAVFTRWSVVDSCLVEALTFIALYKGYSVGGLGSKSVLACEGVSKKPVSFGDAVLFTETMA